MTRFVTHTTNSPMSGTKLNRYNKENPNTKQSDILSLIIATCSLHRFLGEIKPMSAVFIPKRQVSGGSKRLRRLVPGFAHRCTAYLYLGLERMIVEFCPVACEDPRLPALIAAVSLYACFPHRRPENERCSPAEW